MSGGKFKKQLSLLDLTMVALGAIFGSGWLFASSHVAAMAGPGGLISWVIGGVAVLLLGFVYCELGAALPKAGGIIRFPVFSHGELLGFLLSVMTVIAFSSLIAIEVVAARQYAAAWFPSLTSGTQGSPTMLGWIVQFVLLIIFFALNYWSVKTFALANNIISLFKFIVPFLVVVFLLRYFNTDNLTIQGLIPYGSSGVLGAVSAGGIIFAYLGLTPVVSVASEVKNPQRTIPIALILSIILSTVIYILLQLAFLGSIPTDMLQNGWLAVKSEFTLPYHDIAVILGLGWLGILTVADAVISPSGTGNIYMTATPRVIYAWSKNGTFFKKFSHIDAKSGIPRPALWLTFFLSIFWTLPFPSWETLIGVVSAALVMSYAIAPITCGALRKNAPDLPRPFRVSGIAVMGPLSFIIAALIVFWSGWAVVSWLLSVQIVLYVVYLLFKKYVPTDMVSLKQQIASSIWLIGFYAITILISWLGTFGGGKGILPEPYDSIIMAVASLGVYYWGVNTGLPKAIIPESDPEED